MEDQHVMSGSTVSSVSPASLPANPASHPPAPPPPVVLDAVEPVPLVDSLTSYDAVAVYFSFAFHLAVLGIILLTLWLLNLFYLDQVTVVDPLRASLAEETVLDDEPLMQTPALEVEAPASFDAPEDSAVAIAEALSNQSLDAAQILDTVSGAEGSEGDVGLNVVLPGGNAVTKGSFTAWTVPENPAEGQRYKIYIEVKLPRNVTIYRLTDLSGFVRGTDNYTQRLPWDPLRGTMPYVYKNDRYVQVRRSERLRIRGGKAQISVDVHGAARMVRDEITIRSEMLKEEQSLTLVFGK